MIEAGVFLGPFSSVGLHESSLVPTTPQISQKLLGFSKTHVQQAHVELFIGFYNSLFLNLYLRPKKLSNSPCEKGAPAARLSRNGIGWGALLCLNSCFFFSVV